MNDSIIHHDVARYYEDRLRRFGATPAGVDWKDEASQVNRFDQLLRLLNNTEASLIDFGSGFGALLGYMRKQGFTGYYHGIDVAAEMVETALATYRDDPLASFEAVAHPTKTADYALASGIFNVRLKHDEVLWQNYVLSTIEELNRAGSRGFAFNCLTSYSDKEYMRDDLYYADPCFYFDLCKRRYSPHVSLLHDYGLYEFTLIVRKERL